jgi:cell division protease FtsH
LDLKKTSRFKGIKKKVSQHIKLKRELYIALSAFFIVLALIAFSVSLINLNIVSKNKDFHSNVPTITYEELQKDLESKKLVSYSNNIVYPPYLSFSDVAFDPKMAFNINVYRFYYKDGSFKHYVLDKLKNDSLNPKEGKDNTNLYNLKNEKGELITLIAFGISDLLSIFANASFFIIILIGAQLLVGEVIGGKNFAAKAIDVDINFDDIIGYDDVKDQFREISSFIKNKSHYHDNGLTVPRGILLTGEPGVGKTMFAKAFANEVNASLFFASGSDFAEMYVGVGAKRIRNLFRMARISSPSIIFIDEFDAVGSRDGMFKDSERISVINQLLTEMDGLGKKSDIFVIATTNYENKIDTALLRPGRIDKKINIPAPDKNTRKEIIKKYLGNFLADEQTLDSLAIRTQGYSGATLKNLVDETKSLVAKRDGLKDKNVTTEDFNITQETILLGLKKSLDFNAEQEKRIAYHELGHAVASLTLNPSHVVEKITIEPRGNALGFTMIIPTEEQFLYTKEELLKQVCILLAGRAAEEIFLGNITNGARDDLNRANKIVNDMIESFGMGDKHPLLVNIHQKDNGDDHTKEERARILAEQYEITKELILARKDKLDLLAQTLISEKRITGEEMIKQLAA